MRVKYKRSEEGSTTKGHKTTKPQGISFRESTTKGQEDRGPRGKREVKMAKYCSVIEFFPEREQWVTYVEGLQNYFS